MTIFLRVLDAVADEKPAVLLRAVQALAAANGLGGGAREIPSRIFERDPRGFSEVPGTPFAYWVSDEVRGAFARLPRFEAEGRTVKQGLATTDDFRFVRGWWEVSPEGDSAERKWPPFAKGGALSRFYADLHLVVQWDDEAQASYAERTSNFNVLLTSSRADFLYRPGLTWPRRTQAGLGLRAMPAGCIFADKGPAAFVAADTPDSLLALLAITTSAPFRFLVELQVAFGSYEVGIVQRTPVPSLSDADKRRLADLARRAWSLKRTLDATNETSHAFVLPPRDEATSRVQEFAGRIAQIQDEIDDVAFKLYGIGPEDRVIIENAERSTASLSKDGNSEDWEESESDDEPLGVSGLLIYSWLVGAAFGRFDKRLATGQRAIPPEVEPFDPLPSRSAGMWPAGEERNVLSKTVFVDDPNHQDDLSAHMASAAANTGWSVADNLRQWLGREFFPLHIKMYSKSRRKAPIYWQLATPSASYSVWLYIHSFTKDTLHRVQNEYATPKLAHEERRLDAMSNEQRETLTVTDRKALVTQETFVDELRAFVGEIKRVAPLWNPNLDDGVLINFAPLWRLVPQHKPWQRELKSTWDSLCHAEYDWAHLAMHLWPERVVPKCATDRSLAIAHGLGAVFWIEESDGKWTGRKTPTRPVEELVRERTSPAVKAALASLLDAPIASGGSGRTRGGRPRGKATAEERGGH